ncbi:Polyketide synthase [Mycena venus]|uniref:Polyketide synthase n=1 Tax=Mycena venus TaxID=2733690 RepID=A0A8H6YHK7_9AGAR|nr:Polyketide synthase [Mycena venus]
MAAQVGIAAQLPSGSTSTEDLDYNSFWDFLVNGKMAYEPLENIFPSLTGELFLKSATNFDNISLGISVKDARAFPYSARRLFDLSFQALQDAGIDSRGKKIGCFMSGSLTHEGEGAIDTYGSCSWMPSSIANRISYALNITGPSMFLDTACSSSLTALHLAIGAIERNDCSEAIVGAAQINRDLLEWDHYIKAGLLSPDGICKPFDEKADGFGRGEGVIVVVLKPLRDAVRDHDHVYSVVVGSAINATGSRMPLNVPSEYSEQECVYEAYSRAGMKPHDADYIELHATGTSVGDPIEMNAAGSIFAKDVPATFGSVKGNIGHLEVAAFLASLVKACLIFEHGMIPPAVNFSNRARGINWDNFQAVVPIEPIPLSCRSSLGRPTISLAATGIGGSTGHVIIQAPPAPKQVTAVSSTTPVLFLVGGLSSSVVWQISQTISLLDPKDSTQYASTLSRRARQLPWRTYFTVPLSPTALIPPAILVPNERPFLALVFSGQGPQNLKMGRQLFVEYPVFRRTILELDDVYRRTKGVSLLESTGLFTIAKAQSSSLPVALSDSFWPVSITLPAISMIHVAIFDLLKSLGITPDIILGHSAGETAAVYASGAGPKEMAMEIAIARGESMAHTEGREVGMATLNCAAEHAQALIERVTDNADGILEIACFNAPESVTVSGTAALLEQLVARGQKEGVFAQRIRTTVPAHSSLMDYIKDDYLARMHDIFARYPGLHTPEIPVFSTCRDQKRLERFTAEYFWDNCRNAVQFSKAVSHALPSSPVFLEISCHPVLASSVVAHGVPDSRVLCPMRRISSKKSPSSPSSEPEIFLDTMGRLSLLGFNSLDLSGLYGFSALDSTLINHPLISRVIPPPKLLSSQLATSLPGNNRPLSCANLKINKTTHPDLAEHVINGESILPATGFIELLLESGANFLWDVDFISILSLASSSPLEVNLQRLNSNWSVTTNTATGEREHARGCMDKSKPLKLPPPVDFSALWERMPSVKLSDFYSFLEPLATYGPRFQRVRRCHGGPGEAIAEIAGPTAEELAQGYLLHPVLMDACIHIILHPSISMVREVLYLPSRLEHFVFYPREHGTGNWFSHIQFRRWTPEYCYYDVLVTDSHGLALCEMRNLVMKKFVAAEPLTVKCRFDLIFQPASVCMDIPRFDETFSPKPATERVVPLYEILDSLAAEMISKSLAHDIVIGEDESRQRYLSFARRAVETPQNIPFKPEVVKDLRNHWPYHFEVTSRIAAVHEASFKTSQWAVDTLYSDSLMTNFYSEFGTATNACTSVVKAFSGVLDSARMSGKKFVKILEIGAGTGLLTRHIIDELKQNSDLLVEYTLTDISYALVANLARSLSYRSVIPKAYDISKDSDAQDIPSNSYDVIVGLHTLHAAPNVETCLASLHRLLVPGGTLLIVELDGTTWGQNPGNLWLDCIFGSFSEWFGYSDGREHCTMAPAAWKTQLEALDFINVQTSVEDGKIGRDFFFVAQKSLCRSPPVTEAYIDPRYIYTYQFGKEIELQKWLSVHGPTDPILMHIFALQGRDGDAAVGLCATLRKEFPAWDIRLCLFESVSHIVDPVPLVSRHTWTFGGGDNVLLFDRDGVAHVSRIVLSPPPSESAAVSIMDSSLPDDFVISSRHLEDPPVNLPPDILSPLLISLIPPPGPSSPNLRILIAIENSELVAILLQHISSTPRLEVVTIDFTAPDTFHRVDIVLSDSRTYIQHAHLCRWIENFAKLPGDNFQSGTHVRISPRSGTIVPIFFWVELVDLV